MPFPSRSLPLALLLLVAGCGGGGGRPAPAPPPAGPVTGPVQPPPTEDPLFTDVTGDSGIAFTIGFAGEMRNHEVPILAPSGVAAGDYDRDGDVDLFIVRGDLGPNLLYRNDGDLRFAEVAAQAGVAFTRPGNRTYRHGSPAMADLDGDGDLDLLMPGLDGDPSFIFSNEGDGTFTDVTAGSGLDTMRAAYSLSPALGDYDLDGDLDLALGHWGTPRDFIGGVGDTEHLWRNESVAGRIRFASVSEQAGIAPSVILNRDPRISQRAFDPTFTPTFARIDDDAYPDLLMVGDFNFSQVFLNNRDGTFRNVTDYEVIIDGNGMGSAVGDYDGDGDLDWFVSSILAIGENVPTHVSRIGNRLYRNDDGVFVDATDVADVADGGWGWGSCFIDFENDGDLDIYHTNGWTEFDEFGGFSRDESRAFVSDGEGFFRESAASLGLNDAEQGRGVVCADFDNDGDMDILLLHANATNAATLYRNDTEGNDYLGVRLQGRHPNSSAVGARIVLDVDGTEHLREVNLGSNFASHNPTVQLIGLGTASRVDRVTVYWPDGEETVMRGVATNRYVDIEHPRYDPDENAGTRLLVLQGEGSGFYAVGERVEIRAYAPPDNYHFSHWEVTGGEVADTYAAETFVTLLQRVVNVRARYLPGVSSGDGASVARKWNEVLLQSIRNDYARPTVHARNLFHVSAAMYDAWSVIQESGAPWLLDRERAGVACSFDGMQDFGDPEKAAETAASFAAYRLIRHRFRDSPGAADIFRDTDTLMQALDLDQGIETLVYQDGSAEALGNHLADCYIRFGLADGANEADDYANRAYRPVNPPLAPEEPGNPDIEDLNRWQPLSLTQFIDQAGNLVEGTPEFLGPEWGEVVPFALSEDDLTLHERDGYEYWVYHDPGPPPMIDGPLSENYKWAFSVVVAWASHLDPADGEMTDISPAAIGNIQSYPDAFEDYPSFFDRESGGDPGAGYSRNPWTDAPYPPQVVPRGDYTRVLAEFWADGPESETPPGHWFVIANEVNDHPLLVRRFGGAGLELDRLEWDIKTYFALGGAMHDAAVAAWGVKGWHDYIRPISSLRGMAELGQGSDPNEPSYHEHGVPLIPGFIELIDDEDPLRGEMSEHVGKPKFYSWRGPDFIENPDVDVAGVGWIRAEDWWPYQRPTFVTPPFAGYVSGHSTYSRAAAEVLSALTGDIYFPGGMSGFHIPANEFLQFEAGPSVDMTLQWATYQDAADQCSLSRIWGGIHPPIDDIPGRLMGIEIGRDAFAEAVRYFDGAVD
ncbi:MAG: FG-GAP-like repeat-containing protein [Gammaproteobacteria bacterium]|nr:FG-GAP-like repeat-containing protein [Gammaproteobacteria bacterium]